METIIRDTDGRVKGLKVREGYKFRDNNSGRVKYIRAKKGVILCYGGFGAAPGTVRMRRAWGSRSTSRRARPQCSGFG